MSADQNKMRLQSIRSQIPYTRIERNKVYNDEQDKLTIATSEINDSKLFVYDYSALTPDQLKAKALEIQQEHGLGLIVVDYLGLMKVDTEKGKSRESVVAEISRNNKMLAMQLDLPLVEVAQMNRQAFQSSDKRPKLHHLRDSGSIEQDADVVMFPFRPGFYDVPQDLITSELIIAKARNSFPTTIHMEYIGETLTFKEKNPLEKGWL